MSADLPLLCVFFDQESMERLQAGEPHVYCAKPATVLMTYAQPLAGQALYCDEHAAYRREHGDSSGRKPVSEQPVVTVP